MSKQEKRSLRMILDISIDFWNKACAETSIYADKVIILELLAKLSYERESL